ncbi:SRPBCC domain-containing protein [Turneriella parva]|uniref:Activator of Hsp90 ATPase 1 family protein n=1 Tax=Turneriella parva (strain ATCC BAA-1111 / DSM 21527 / NCTC 11395 / H) TaxID=869212 RepID=I4B2R0_TURPD|nr:SRPBCC domain-containing protein [Turneriella parva]AFM11567.1 Activator of Hsp90 ATPase 1 family protein [Turneriella parva DSM 21527]
MSADSLVAPDDSPHTIVNTRTITYSRESVYEGFAKPSLLAEWWGPNGFKNTFHEFDFKPGGIWRFTMHAPNGSDFENFCRFVEIRQNELIVFDHIEPVHAFRMSIEITKAGMGTQVNFVMTFVLQEEYERVKDFVRIANEENFDRLEAVLQRINEAKIGNR